MRKPTPIKVGVLFGGPSAEHQVSCASALSVLRALPLERCEPVPIGITGEGRFVLPSIAHVDAALEADTPSGLPIEDRLEASGEKVVLLPGKEPGTAAVAMVESGYAQVAELDVVFPVLHGPYGEDGVVQGFLEATGVPYVGAGVLGSAISINKIAMKNAFVAAGLPITPFVHVHEELWRGHPEPSQLTAELSYPLFVKPANMGSSIGVSRVSSPADLAAAIESAFVYDHLAVIEQGVVTEQNDRVRELECGVLGGLYPISSLPGEVDVHGDWFDYDLKYRVEGDPMIVPADLPKGVVAKVRHFALRAFKAVSAWGLGRVDFLYDEVGDRLIVNEINAMPGFTAYSMYPKVWAATGISYDELIERLLDLAFERHRLTARRRTTPTGSGDIEVALP